MSRIRIPTKTQRGLSDALWLGNCDEEFHANLYEWDKHAYETQWLQSLERLLGDDQKAVLITNYVNQQESSNLEWWAL